MNFQMTCLIGAVLTTTIMFDISYCFGSKASSPVSGSVGDKSQPKTDDSSIRRIKPLSFMRATPMNHDTIAKQDQKSSQYSHQDQMFETSFGDVTKNGDAPDAQYPSDYEDKRDATFTSTAPKTESGPGTQRMQTSSHRAINRPFKVMFDPGSRNLKKLEHFEKSEHGENLQPKSKTDQSVTAEDVSTSKPAALNITVIRDKIEGNDNELNKLANRPPWLSQTEEPSTLDNHGSDEGKERGSFSNQAINNKTKNDTDLDDAGGDEQNRFKESAEPISKFAKESTNEERCGADKPDDGRGLKCSKISLREEEAKRLRMMMFKKQLLAELHLDPNRNIIEVQEAKDSVSGYAEGRYFNKDFNVPDSVLELNDSPYQQEENDLYTRTDLEVIIPGYDMGNNCIHKRTTGCYMFDLKPNINDKVEVSEAQVWLYKMKDKHDVFGQTLKIYEVQNSRKGHLHVNLLGRENIYMEEGWITLSLKGTRKHWKNETLLLAVRCETCFTKSYRALYGAKQGYKPLLVIKFADKPRIRRRSIRPACDDRINCCLKPLTVNITAHLLHGVETINSPLISIGYCYGFCDDLSRYVYNYTQVTQVVRNNNNHLSNDNDLDNNTDLHSLLMPCCVPTSLLNVSMLTLENGMLKQHNIPHTKVRQCGCV